MSIQKKTINRESNRSQSLRKRNDPEPWRRRAPDFVPWVLLNLVNRHDGYIGYLPTDERSKTKKVRTIHGALSREILRRHCCGHDGDLVGIHAISNENTCRWIAIDIDNHGDGTNVGETNERVALLLYCTLKEYGFSPLCMNSNGDGGYHILVLFSSPIPSKLAYGFAHWLVRDWQKLGLAEKPEAFPKQPSLTRKIRFGSALRLPGRHHTRDHFTRIWNGKEWLWGDRAIDAILAIVPSSPELIPVEALVQEDAKINSSSLKCPAKSSCFLDAKNANTNRILRRLDNVQSNGEVWSARCPSHRDRNNSLSVSESADGKVLIHCHAGCEIEAIVEDLELSMSDLFPKTNIRTRRQITGGIRTRTNRGEQ